MHIIRIDLGQWAEALLTVGSAVSHPVGGILVGREKPGGVHISRGSLSPGRFEGARGETENENHDGASDQAPIVRQPNDGSKTALARRSGAAYYRAHPNILPDPRSLHRTDLPRITRRGLGSRTAATLRCPKN